MSVSFYLLKDDKVINEGFNQANGNAAALFSVLNIEIETEYGWCGELKVEDVKRKCEELLKMYKAMPILDQGRPTRVDGIVTHCGTPDGYISDKLERLLKLCIEAKETNSRICYA